MTNNPISEANPASLDKLFSDNPLNLSDTDIEQCVLEFRRMRAAWQDGTKPAKKEPKAKISLADLGL
jgi:hypothetical protein